MKKVLKLSLLSLLIIFCISVTIYIFYNKNNTTANNDLIKIVEKYDFEVSIDPDGLLSITRQTGDYSGCGINESNLSYFCSITIEGEMDISYFLVSSNDKVDFIYRDDRNSKESKCELNNEIDLKEQVSSCDDYYEFSKNIESFERLVEDFSILSEDMKQIEKDISN